MAKLIARECQDLQAIVVVLFIRALQALVIGVGVATLQSPNKETRIKDEKRTNVVCACRSLRV
jgi:hypothetical protein